MVRHELVELLKAEIQKYLGIPYFRNKLGRLASPLNTQVGKGTYHEIALATIAAANKQNINLLKLDNRGIYNFQKKNHLGIDCSGLTYHLVDKLYQLLHDGESIEDKLIGTDGKTGVRRLNADKLTGPENSSPVTDYNKVKPGDLIRLDKGHHVIFIFQKIGSKIYYVNSSDKTRDRGVHLGILTITDPTKPLNTQLWTDELTSGAPYNTLVHPDSGDGIYRLNCLK